MEELRGLADGSDMPFYQLFLNMLQEEFSYVVPQELRFTPSTHCSDYIMKTPDNAIIVHNEDGSGLIDFNRTIIVKERLYIGGFSLSAPCIIFRWKARLELHRLHLCCSDSHCW